MIAAPPAPTHATIAALASMVLKTIKLAAIEG
jgi:hypothetical protein